MAMWFCGLSAVTWISRTLYAFARDNGLPGSAVWRRVSATHQTPAPAIWLSVVVAFFATISAGTYAVVTSISVIGLYFSYIIPVYLASRARSRGQPVPRGPWHLGRVGPVVNIVAIVWVIFISIVLSIPDGLRAGKTMAALTALLFVWYVVSERRRFKGPAWALSGGTGARLAGALDVFSKRDRG
jgi:amino acid transporter